MARPRRNVETDKVRQSADRKSGSDGKRTTAGTASKKSAASTDSQTYNILGVIALALSVVVYYYVQNWLDTRVVTPLNVPKAVTKSGLDVPSLYWGSYRPGAYFGLKTRSAQSPVFGLMWFAQKITNNQLPIRHWCEMGDFSQRYSWLEHDVENFGLQELHDDNIVLTTSFIKRPGGSYGGDWTARISASVEDPSKPVSPLSLLFYVALDVDGQLEPHVRGTHLASVGGNTHATGPFRLGFPASEGGAERILATNYLSTEAVGLEVLKETVMNSLAYFTTSPAATRRSDAPKYVGLVGEKYPEGMSTSQRQPNFVVHQITVTLPFHMEVTYESFAEGGGDTPLTGAAYDAELTRLRKQFDERFHRTFDLGNYSAAEVTFAKAAFSNLVGGFGYFHGRSSVQGHRNKEPLPYFEAPLFTAVPSRSFFPRGFLWDEGFHQLLVARWSPALSREVLAHWLDLINRDGWIPREQILDREALARVPAEFVVQRDVNANPPTLFMPLRALLDAEEELGEQGETLLFVRAVFPRLEAWFNWFNTTQLGSLPGTYRWRGRSNVSAEELNPITLTSGLDDYPRASHPTDDERHVDLRCWMAYASGVMADAARLLGRDWLPYDDTHRHLSDNRLLDRLHWSEELGAYADYGLHTDKVKLVRPKPPPPSAPGQPSPPIQRNPVRVYGEEPKLQFVNSHGYVSLFPLLLRILRPDSDKLGRMLANLEREDLLWTEYGLRSLSRTAPLYSKPNTPSSPPYWRGAIWININYLALSALRHYADVEGPHRQRAELLHGKLREALVKNLFRQYVQTGYMWEQYNDRDGSGQRAHPFTGWSALVTLIMAGH